MAAEPPTKCRVSEMTSPRPPPASWMMVGMAMVVVLTMAMVVVLTMVVALPALVVVMAMAWVVKGRVWGSTAKLLQWHGRSWRRWWMPLFLSLMAARALCLPSLVQPWVTPVMHT